ncbi:hypothetical protein ACPWT1_06565 [Ramlibacter sp. MMS24-I3-19]|uniref:ATP-dependent DNA ligase n=1 Tax=Ramlibacter sp. MMS24-I3-19 TaxID=3416606 RepID=UPI003CFEF372
MDSLKTKGPCDPFVFAELFLDLLAAVADSLTCALNVGHFDAKQGADLYRHGLSLKLEGLVAKRLGSKYVPGERSADWIKCKVQGAVPPERFKR